MAKQTLVNPLDDYITDALKAGQNKTHIIDTLTQAGWRHEMVSKVMRRYIGLDEKGLIIPAPQTPKHHNVRDFFVYLLIFVTLGMTVWALGDLCYQLINHFFPSNGSSAVVYHRGYHNMSWPIAQLVVACPTYLFLTLFNNGDMDSNPEKRESLIRKLLVYVVLFATAVTALGDIAAVLYHFLDGEITMRFFLKAVVVFVMSGSVFSFYLNEMKRDDMLIKNDLETD